MWTTVDTFQHFSSASIETLSLKTNSSFSDFIELKVPRRILNSPDVAAEVNRHKLSPNAFNDIFAAIVSASGGNINEFVLSTSTNSQTTNKCLH